MIRILVSTSVLIFSLLTNFQSTHASPAILQLISDQKDLICDFFDSSKFKQTPLATWEVQEGEISIRLYDRQSPASISLDYKPTRANWRLLTVTTNDSTGLPYLQMRMSQDCEIRLSAESGMITLGGQSKLKTWTLSHWRSSQRNRRILGSSLVGQTVAQLNRLLRLLRL